MVSKRLWEIRRGYRGLEDCCLSRVSAVGGVVTHGKNINIIINPV